MKFKVIFRAQARDEAIEAADFIAAQGLPDTALRWYQGLEKAIASLSVLPRRCHRAREQPGFPDIELRQLRYKSHRLIFTIRAREVHILHVWHAARKDIDQSGSPEPIEE